MTYSPNPDNTRPLFITIALTAMSVFCFLFAGHLPNFKWLLQLLFVCFATAAIQMFMKYVLTKFRYVCDGNSLFIYKALGRKELLVGKLELVNSASYLASEKAFLESNENYNIKSSYTYTRNFGTKDVFVYVTTLGESNYMIKIEADDEFAKYVNKKIDECLKGSKENDEV